MTGTVALMRGVHPHLERGARRACCCMQSADPSAQCRNPTDPTTAGCGAGLVDVDAAIVLRADGERFDRRARRQPRARRLRLRRRWRRLVGAARCVCRSWRRWRSWRAAVACYKRRVPKVEFEREGVVVEARAGQTLLEVAEASGVELFRGLWPELHCRTRKGWCRRCKVWVRQGSGEATRGAGVQGRRRRRARRAHARRRTAARCVAADGRDRRGRTR